MSRTVAAALSIGIVLAIAGTAVAALPACGAEDAGASPFALRLGMGPRDVRSRLARELPGELVVAPAEELAYAWNGHADGVRSLRLELHEGKLVAVRARIAASHPLAQGDRLWRSASAVLSRAARPDGDIDFVLIARDCPTHRAEVARLLSSEVPPATSP